MLIILFLLHVVWEEPHANSGQKSHLGAEKSEFWCEVAVKTTAPLLKLTPHTINPSILLH